MDGASIHSAVTVLLFVAFVAIVIWAYSARNRKEFDAAGRIPFEEDGKPASRPASGDKNG